MGRQAAFQVFEHQAEMQADCVTDHMWYQMPTDCWRPDAHRQWQFPVEPMLWGGDAAGAPSDAAACYQHALQAAWYWDGSACLLQPAQPALYYEWQTGQDLN